MSGWGEDPWGLGTWGGIGESESLPSISSITPNVLDSLGGTVVLLVGSGFFDPTQVEFLREDLSVAGKGEYVSARLDLRLKRLYIGSPALPVGVYGLRVTTIYGSVVVSDAVQSLLFADELKVQRMRSRWGTAWAVGPRLFGS